MSDLIQLNALIGDEDDLSWVGPVESKQVDRGFALRWVSSAYAQVVGSEAHGLGRVHVMVDMHC